MDELTSYQKFESRDFPENLGGSIAHQKHRQAANVLSIPFRWKRR